MKVDIEIIEIYGTASDCFRSACKDIKAYKPSEVSKVRKVIGLFKYEGEYYQAIVEIDKDRNEFTPENLQRTIELENA